MDQLEYKLLKHEYSEEELKKINDFNKSHTDMAKNLLKYNRDNILNNEIYAKMEIKDRIKYVQKLEDFQLFCRTYPIVSKYIIAFGLFSSKAFKKYLNWKSNIRPSDTFRNELINNPRKQELWKNKYVYAIYVKYLFQEKNAHSNLNDINQIYLQSVNALNAETNEFFNLYEKELNKMEETKKEYNSERKNKIKEQIKIKLQKDEN
jgi:hypothetical protein